MTYHEHDPRTLQFPLYHRLHPPRQHQQQQQQYRVPAQTFNNINNRFFSPRHSPSQTLRIECKAEERHFIRDSSSSRIRAPLQPIRVTMNDQYKPVQFRSEIIVHNDPDIDVHIKSLRVAFHYHDETPTEAMAKHHYHSPPNSPLHSQSTNRTKKMPTPPSQPPTVVPKTTSNENRSIRNLDSAVTTAAPLSSQALLHQWIDDICANEELMSNDDIVFFIKNGEFFARI